MRLRGFFFAVAAMAGQTFNAPSGIVSKMGTNVPATLVVADQRCRPI